ncbi:hypothetical protein B0H10DRAFT_2390545, partial [Mycena sp. CBHHK59/15]
SSVPFFTISPIKNESRYSYLLNRPALTAREQELVNALHDMEERDKERKRAMIGMQAGVLLAGMYSNHMHAQLQSAEDRKQKKRGRCKMGDGKAKYFTGDEFFQLCVDDEKAKEEEAVEKEQQRVQRENHATELADWKKKNTVIRARNKVKKATYAEDTTAWDEEKVIAKQEGRRPRWTKPKLKDYDLENLVPRPKKIVEEEKEDEEEDERSSNGSEMEQD